MLQPLQHREGNLLGSSLFGSGLGGFFDELVLGRGNFTGFRLARNAGVGDGSMRGHPRFPGRR